MTESVDDAVDVTPGRDVPTVDAVGSRWWYWIAAYPIATLLAVPLALFAIILFVTPITLGDPESALVVPIVGLLLVLLLIVVGALMLILVVIFPVALYMDARAVSQADLDWNPDPFLYGILGILQFVATPIIGLIVAVYYLYRRHQHVGVP